LSNTGDAVKRVIQALFLAAFVSVCLGNTGALFVSGAATAYNDRQQVQQIALDSEQLEVLSSWFEQRHRKWHPQLTESSTEPLALSIDLNRNDGTIDHLEIVASRRGGYYARLSIGPGIHWAYRSIFGILKTRYAVLTIDDHEVTLLSQVLFGGRLH
jgi:hypothetical protein